MRTKRALERERGRIATFIWAEMRRVAKNNQPSYALAHAQGMQQAIWWALGDNSMSPSRCLPRRDGKVKP